MLSLASLNEASARRLAGGAAVEVSDETDEEQTHDSDQ